MRIARSAKVFGLEVLTLITTVAVSIQGTAAPSIATNVGANLRVETTTRTNEQGSQAKQPAIQFRKYQLPNGLEVILHPDDSQPFVAVNIWYHIGPVNEPKGRSGFAHLFEHLMFEGSKHVGPNFDRLLEGVGATNSNGTTSWDRTNYFETVPREHLELLLWIESDRMGFLRESITNERLNVQRDVVKNERRQSYENAPYGPSTLTFLDTLFPQGHPYHGAVIGSMDDLTAATLADVHAFADQYYAPSNATLCVAGAFDTATIESLIAKYFGPLRNAPKAATKTLTTPPPLTAKRIVIDEPVSVAKVAFGWVTPPAYHDSNAVLSVLATLLTGGKATRLYRSLVINERVAIDVDADIDANALGSVFAVDAMASANTPIEILEASLQRELYRIIDAPPTPQELVRAKKRLKLEFVNQLALLNGPGGESGRAGLLQRFNHYLGDPSAIFSWQNRLDRVTSAEIVDAVKNLLQPTTRITVVTRPNQTPSR